MNRRLSIRGSVIVLEIAIVLPLLALLAYAHHASLDQSVRQARQSSLGLARLAAATVDQQILRYHAIVRGIAKRPRIRDFGSGRCDPIFEDFGALYPHFNNLVLVDARGDLVCSATHPGAPDETRYPFGSWLREALDGRDHAIGPAFDGVTPAAVAIASPVRDDEGRPIGAVAIVTDLSRQTRPGHLPLPDQGVLTMIDPQGTVLVRSREPERYTGRSGIESDIVRIALENDQGSTEARGLDGVQRLYGYTTIPSLGWKVYAGVPADLVLADPRARSMRSLGVSLAVLALLTLVILYANRRIGQELARIGATAHALASGRRESRFPVEGPREIVRLAADLNRMLTHEERERQHLAAGLAHQRRLIDAAADGLIVYELDAHGRPRRFLEVNETACRMLECPRDEILRRNPAEFEERAADAEPPAALDTGVRQAFLRAKSGRVVPVEIHAQALVLQGKRTLIAVVRDTTRRRRADDEARERDARARRDEVQSAIGALVTGLAHDVRNPLFGISATLDALESRLGADERYREYVEVLRQSATRVNDVLGRVVDYARPPALERRAASIEDVIAEACRRVEPEARAANVALEFESPGALPGIRADVDRLVQGVLRVLENAVQHAPPGSVALVTVRRVVSRGRPWVECEILDSGPGFADEDLGRAVQPLFTRSAERAGLGLAVAKQIAEQHGGEIELANRPDGGAAVTLRLPVAEA